MRSKLGVSALLFFVAACGGSGSDESPAEDRVGAPSRDTDPVTGSPDANQLTEEHGVFVVASAAPDGDGTRTRPLSTIMSAIALAKANGKRVFVCADTYKEQLVLEDGVSINGNLDCARPESWQLGKTRARLEAPTTLAIRANGITKSTRIEGFDIFAADATEPSRSSMGLWAVGSPGLAFANASIHSGKGARGADGKDGVQLVLGADAAGASGNPGSLCSIYWCRRPPPRKGGKGSCTGELGHDAEDGGEGGVAGLYEKYFDGGEMETRFRPAGNDPAFAAGPAPLGRTGANGVDGSAGTSASTWGALSRDGFASAEGTRGTSGSPGKGGRGGDGREPQYAPPPSQKEHERHYGNEGGGGGAGGCPGLVGTPGTGGGASVAALLVDSAVTFDSIELVSGDGGDGGKGSFGSDFTIGGLGGANGAGGRAQSGGRGGAAGISGSGAGGPSFALAYTGPKPALITSTTKVGKPGAGVSKMTRSTEGVTRTIPASAAGTAAPTHTF